MMKIMNRVKVEGFTTLRPMISKSGPLTREPAASPSSYRPSKMKNLVSLYSTFLVEIPSLSRGYCRCFVSTSGIFLFRPL